MARIQDFPSHFSALPCKHLKRSSDEATLKDRMRHVIAITQMR